MVLVLALALALWFAGRLFRVPVRVRFILIAVLYLAVLTMQLVLPAGSSLREATGGSATAWLVAGALAAAIWGYWRVLRQLRGRARPENREGAGSGASTVEVERNARHIALREIGGTGQKRLKGARALVVGAGGLGAPVLQYLAAAGVGTIGVIDGDAVENSNLQRQVIHSDARIGMPKVFSAQKAMAEQNPFVNIRPYNRRLTREIAADLFADYDLVLDGTDDVETRYLVNEFAVRARIPLVSGAIAQWEGQVSVFDPARGGPCYACVFPEPAAPGLAPSCAEAGVLGPLPGVLGTMMAVEAIKVISGAGEALMGSLLIYDALYGETRSIRLSRRPDCPVCA
ncbi:MAG: HesA/MoeB/ThiF family protein [Boseongicola sp. SB0677_bin_26]|nr:HesA/MoeB/ThiF family protein [Boseongicola sp. SB0665_bin_10]MYG25358.1 HesA/MoeB/ThiF family protein [Boseongicola sp. SB0677_bin_26]